MCKIVGMATDTKAFETVTEQADRLLAAMELPPEVESITTNLGEDESGELALFVRLHLAKNAVTKKTDIRNITDFTERVQILLMGSGITYFPYVFLDEAA